jgi:hypothetical protein
MLFSFLKVLAAICCDGYQRQLTYPGWRIDIRGYIKAQCILVLQHVDPLLSNDSVNNARRQAMYS